MVLTLPHHVDSGTPQSPSPKLDLSLISVLTPKIDEHP